MLWTVNAAKLKRGPKPGTMSVRRRLDPDFPKRLQMAMTACGKTDVAKLAKEMKCTPQAIYRLLRLEGGSIDPFLLMDFGVALNINVRWLLLEDGPMVRNIPTSPDEQILLEVYRSLPAYAANQWLESGRTYQRLYSQSGNSDSRTQSAKNPKHSK